MYFFLSSRNRYLIKWPVSENLSFDGHNMWPVLKEEEKSMYDEILVNIDEIQNVTALRKGDWKIITGIGATGTIIAQAGLQQNQA